VEKDVLLLGANAPDLQILRSRLTRIGYRVVPVKTPDQAHMLLRVGGTRVGAVIVPSDLPFVDLRSALEALRRVVPGHHYTMLGAGRDPGSDERRRMREAGVQIAIFDPIDTHTLRFQLNRALAAHARSVRCQRDTLRAPADWSVIAKAGGRQKEGRVYAISASGAFVALEQPWMVRSKIELEISIPTRGRVQATGRVVMTNVPGNMAKKSLPNGMGIQFEQLSEAVSVHLVLYAQERLRTLAL